MKFLVLGASGMAGHMICLYLNERGHEVTGYSRRGVGFVRSIAGDASDDSLLERTICGGGFDVVVNAVGILNNDAEARKAQAVYINAYLPHRLAEITTDLPTRVFSMSTDCVFSGNTGPYDEGSFPDGRTFYDRTKALGELWDEKNLTLRNSIVGPDINENGIGLLNWFMRQEGPLYGFVDAMWTGMTTLELSKAIEICAEDGSAGLVNMVPDTAISKYDLLLLFNKYLRNGDIEIRPSNEVICDKTLVRRNMGPSFRVAPYEVQVREMADWMITHARFYPHYLVRAKRSDRCF